jgi:hypothetical protein
VGVSRCGHTVLFDALFDNAMRNGEHLIDKSREICVFTPFILGGRFWVIRHNSRALRSLETSVAQWCAKVN